MRVHRRTSGLRAVLATLFGAGFCFARFLAAAQDSIPLTTLPAEWTTVDDGLPQGMVRTILQDRTGYMWFGTKDGLVRSDGHTMRVYKHVEGDSTSISGDHITALLEDSDSSLWAATEHHGLNRYDPRTGRFARVNCTAPDAGQRTFAIRYMQQDAAGNLWVVNQDHMLSVIPAGTRHRPHAELLDPRSFVPTWPIPDSVHNVLATPQGDIWFFTRDSILVLDREGARQREWSLPLYRLADRDLDWVPAARMDPRTNRVVLVFCHSVLTFDAQRRIPVDTFRVDIGPLGAHMLLDDEERVWLTLTEFFGAGRLDLRTGRIEHIRFEPLNRTGLPRVAGVCHWAKDREGNIWAGTVGYGLLKYNSRMERFRRLGIGQSMNLCSTDARGSTLLEVQTLRTVRSAGGFSAPLAIGEAMAKAGLARIWGNVVIDQRGAQWAAVKDRNERALGLAILGARPGAALEMMRIAGQVDILQLRSGQGDDLWLLICTTVKSRGDRLLRIDSRTREVLAEYPLPEPIDVREYAAISDQHIDADGTLRMGTLKGVMILDPESGTWRHYRHEPARPHSLPDSWVLSIQPDPQDPTNILWVGTNGAGLARLDLRTGSCGVYTMRDGLPNDVIYGVLGDAHGSLWLSTNNGLCLFDPKTGSVVTFTKEDGVAGNEFNRYGAVRMEDGHFCFAGVDGLTLFDPEDFYRPIPASPTVITGLRLDNLSVDIASPGTDPGQGFHLNAPIDRLSEVVLSHDQRMLTFLFASMDHTAPAKNRYRYILEGFNEQWIESGASHEATFTNLDPGEYTFRVQGRNSAGIWDEKGGSIALIITPPWWGTWWFRLAAVLAFAGGLYAFYRYRLAQELRVSLMRDRIARDLHDEIGSTLSSVALFSEVAKGQGPTPGSVRTDMLTRISESTSQMVESMNDIVWAVNSKNDELLQIAQRMQEFAGRIAEACGFELDFSYDGIDGSRSLEMVQRKNLYLIFKEAVNNAVKYAQCRKLTVRLTSVHGELVLRVQDDGIGFESGAPKSMRGGGNGLRNMQSRAEEIKGTLRTTSAPGQGTIVELRFKP